MKSGPQVDRAMCGCRVANRIGDHVNDVTIDLDVSPKLENAPSLRT